MDKEPTVDQKLDMLMEAIMIQQNLLKQVLLSFDKILSQLADKPKSKLITMDNLK
jgi:hypothetical protein